MSFSIRTSKLTGIPDSSGWAQVFEYKPDDPLIFQKKGQLLAVIATNKQNEQVDSVKAGREIISKLQSEYYGPFLGGESYPVDNPLHLLKNAVKKVFDEYSKWEGVQIGVMVVVDKYAYLVVAGKVRIFLSRSGMLVNILENPENDIKSASGIIKANDIYLLSTQSFLDKSTKGVIKALLNSKKIDAVAEYFAPVIHSGGASGDMGMILVEATEAELHKEQEPKKLISLAEEPAEQIRLNIQKNEFREPETITKATDGLKAKAAGLFRKLLEPKIYLNQEVPDVATVKRRKLSASVGVLLILVLFVSIFFGVKQKKQREYKNSYEQNLTEAEHKIAESENLISLNPERSRELFLEGKSKVDDMVQSGVEDENLSKLKGKIETIEGRVLGVYTVSAANFIDISLASDNFEGTGMVLTDDILYAFDKANKKIVKTEVSSKRTEVSAGPAKISDSARAFAAYLDNIYVFQGDGVFEVSGDKKKVLENSWSGEVLSYGYAGNLYVIEKEASKIWRYASGGNAFSAGKEWLIAESGADLSGSNKVVIDGNIWVLSQNGKIQRFSAGNLLNFRLSSDYRDLVADDIFTSEDWDYLFLMDKKESRILVFTKSGEYKFQYSSSDIKDASAFVASKSQKKIILLKGDKLLTINLEDI